MKHLLYPGKPTNNDSIEKVILELKQKSRSKEITARISLAFIVLVILLGLVVFAFATQITSSKKSLFDNMELENKHLSTRLKHSSDLYDSIIYATIHLAEAKLHFDSLRRKYLF